MRCFAIAVSGGFVFYLRERGVFFIVYRLTTPDAKDRGNLWRRVINWRDLYVLHVMGHDEEDTSTPESIKTPHSTFGEVMRYIYYGSSDIITS